MSKGDVIACYTVGMDGILVINKPAGMTSHDVIGCLRRRYKQKKFGHTGTLDPNASGVLVVLAGRAAKLLQFLPDTDKQYIAGIQLGCRTTTDDIWGEVTEEKPVNRDFDFGAVLSSFEGRQHQRVPDTSAKKVNGKKLMDYQRRSQEVPAVYADVTIYDTRVLDEEDLTFELDCSAGTYVRSLCRDFGEKTGNAACMKSLVRTKASGFSLEQAEDLDAEEHTLYPMESVLTLPEVHWENREDILNGRHIRIPDAPDQVSIFCDGELMAIYERDHKDVFACKRGLWA